jgi:hypothetical protein
MNQSIERNETNVCKGGNHTIRLGVLFVCMIPAEQEAVPLHRAVNMQCQSVEPDLYFRISTRCSANSLFKLVKMLVGFKKVNEWQMFRTTKGEVRSKAGRGKWLVPGT